MAKMSSQARNRRANAQYVVVSMRENQDPVVQGLMTHNAWLPVELHIREDTLREVLTWLANAVQYKTSSMLAAETAYVNEQSDDPPVRARRDDAVEPVYVCMTQSRSKTSKFLGDTGLATYGMREPVPRQPAELAMYAETVLGLVRQHPFAVSDGTGGIFDASTLSAGIEAPLTPLTQALADVVVEQRQLQSAMIRRDTEVEEWREVYLKGSAMFASIARMAGQDELAQRVRPTVRRARGHEAGPGDDTSSDIPADADGAPGEEPAGTPAPIAGTPTT